MSKHILLAIWPYSYMHLMMFKCLYIHNFCKWCNLLMRYLISNTELIGISSTCSLVDVLFITWHSICSWCHCVPFVDADVHVHCVLPGVVNTNIYRHLPFRKSAFVAVSFAPFFWFLTKTPDDGAQTTLYALLGVSAGKTTGKIYK